MVRSLARAGVRGECGFTLVEMLVTLAIAAILTTVAVPSFAAIMHSVHLSAGANALLASLRLARSEAVRRGDSITICRSGDGTACAAQGGWDQGWIVFHDLDANARLDAGDLLMQRHERLGEGYRLVGNTSVARGFVVNAQGVHRGLAGGMLAGTLTLCKRSAGPTEGRKIVLSSGGRPRLQPAKLDHCA